MKHQPLYQLHSRVMAHWHLVELFAVTLLWVGAGMGTVWAASITSAQVAMTDSRPAQPGVSYTVSFTLPTATAVKSLQARVCTAISNCQTPSGFSAAAANLSAQPSGLGSPSGWFNDSTAGALRIKNSTNTATPSGPQVVAFTGITNPDSQGTYYILLSTYADDTYSALIDQTAIAFSMNQAVTVSLTVDPTLSFGVSGLPATAAYKGSLTTADRCVDSPTGIKFGTASLPLAPDTDYDCGQTLTTSTNNTNGYQITIRSQAPGDSLKNVITPGVTIPDWTGSNSAPSATPSASNVELFGYTTNDSRLLGTPDRFTAFDNLFAGLTTTDSEIAHAPSPVSNDNVNIGFRLRFKLLSVSGSYSGKVIYTCTTTF